VSLGDRPSRLHQPQCHDPQTLGFESRENFTRESTVEAIRLEQYERALH
jgi:hypothetical protein